MKENVIEWVARQDNVTATLFSKKLKNRIYALKEKYPDEIDIISENKNGSILVHFPLDWLKIVPPRTFSEERREAMKKHGNELYEKYLKKDM